MNRGLTATEGRIDSDSNQSLDGIRGDYACRYSRRPIDFRAEQGLLHDDGFQGRDPDESQPSLEIRSLEVICPGGCAGRWTVVQSSSADQERLAPFQQAAETPLIECEQYVFLRHHIDEVLQLVWDREVPERNTQYQRIGGKKSRGQASNVRPGGSLFLSQTNTGNACIFCFQYRTVEFRELCRPQIQGINGEVRIGRLPGGKR